MSENLSMVVLMGRIGQLLGVTRWQLKNSRGAVAVGIYEFDDEADGIAPVAAMSRLNGKVMTQEEERELFDRIWKVVDADSIGKKFDTESIPALCLQIGTGKKHLGSVIITTALTARSKTINEPLAISQIVRWINENVEQGENVRVLNVYGRFADGETVHEAEFTH